MGKVYKNQTAIALNATVNQDITGATSLLLKYIKPDFTLGSFIAVSTDDTNGVLRYAITSADDLDQAGEWTFWGYALFADGTYAPGEPYTLIIYEEGS